MQVRLRKLMIDMVLGTDMKQHCTIISRFQTVLQVKLHSHMMATDGATSASADGRAIKFEDPADRSMLLQVLQFSTVCARRDSMSLVLLLAFTTSVCLHAAQYRSLPALLPATQRPCIVILTQHQMVMLAQTFIASLCICNF